MDEKISKRVQKMDASGIRRMFDLTASMKNPINLSIGQPDYDVPKVLRDFAKMSIDSKKNSYTPTQGILPLRSAIVDKLKNRRGLFKDFSVDNVLITGAVSGALSLVMPTLLDEGDEVIIFDPFFVGYKQVVLLYGGKPVFVSKNEDFSINFEALKSAITDKTKMILINTPENPTGYVYSRSELIELAEVVRERGIYVVSDEIYEDFVYDKEFTSIAEFYEKTILVNGFSKNCAMTGWRVGYMVAPVEVVEECAKVQQFTFVCAPTPFQYACIEAVNFDVSGFLEDFAERRDLVYEGLKENFEVVKCEGAFYFFVRYPYEGKRFIADCLERNLLVVPGSAFSERDEFFRISFVNSKEKLSRAVEILNELVLENK